MPDGRGWGLVCTHELKSGDFCCEYVGERITCSDTVKRMNGLYKNLRHTYLLQLGPDEVQRLLMTMVICTCSTPALSLFFRSDFCLKFDIVAQVIDATRHANLLRIRS